MPDDLKISYEQLRSLVIETLRDWTDGQILQLNEAVAATARKHGLFAEADDSGIGWRKGHRTANVHDRHHRDSLSRHDYSRMIDIVWDFIVEGVVRPGVGDGTNNELPHFHVTDRGKIAIQEVEPSPYDPDGYLGELTSAIPKLDPVILGYLNESLHTFRINCLLSSTISLGCASEKAFLLLIAAYGNSLNPNMQKKFKANTEGRMIKRQFDEFYKMLQSELRSRLPKDIADGLDIELTALFDFIRNQRNDAGHPTGKKVERSRAYANLAVVPTYLKKVYSLIDWIDANPLP